MHVNRICLKDFRNYENLEISLGEGVNIFYGANAQGKTNLLESIYYTATGRSHRTTNDQECIRQGASQALVRLFFSRNQIEEQVEVVLRKNGRKSILVNRFPARKISEVFGLLKVVLFSPEDLSLIKSGPALRRRFMDMELCQVDPVYLYQLQQYYKVLRQRNAVLKDLSKGPYRPKAADEALYPWDAQLADLGARLALSRQAFVTSMEEFAKEIHDTISQGKEKLSLKYIASASGDQEEILRLLEKEREKDIRYGATGRGIQHDDIEIYLNTMNARYYGSQGQQRSAALSLKLAETRKIQAESGQAPVLLLDDVMSELDEMRQKQLLSYIENIQTIITCTGIEDIFKHLPKGEIYHVTEGEIAK